MISKHIPKLKKDASEWLKTIANVFFVMLTFHVIFVGDIFFRSVSFDQSANLLSTLLTESSFTVEFIEQFKTLSFFILPIFIIDLFTTKKPIEDLIYEIPIPFRYCTIYVMFFLVYFYGVSKPTFIYFQF